jgi:hypothetical protein
MAGRGPAPKPVLQRESRTQARHDSATKLADDGVVRGDALPEGMDWHPRTLAWWDNWRRSPLAQQFSPVDWDVLLETALLHTQFWNGDAKVAAELRLRVGKMGATPEDRQRLHLQVDTEAAEAKAATPVVKPDRRRRLLKVVENGGA